MVPRKCGNCCCTAERWSRWEASIVEENMRLENLDRARRRNRGRSLDASWHRVSDPAAPLVWALEGERIVVGYGGGGGETEIRRNESRWIDGKGRNKGW